MALTYSHQHPSWLSETNAMLKTLDLVCKMLGPAWMGLIYTYMGSLSALFFVGIVNLIVAILLLVTTTYLYHQNRSLAFKQARLSAVTTLPPAKLTHNKDKEEEEDEEDEEASISSSATSSFSSPFVIEKRKQHHYQGHSLDGLQEEEKEEE